ncbi:hypothetical protein [Phycicoccus sp. Root101]|uniref:hypothetical protein n=1 Tax=Phycicoccus sp. Root101 TaxID=1736421 RepID=UPI0007028EEB|nr:hypothetical protein [Phycicoccus sp. Root101]KQU67555.1 hypothetical protein ASC58_13495 [Phycicoccus sp. Root101]
MAFLVPARFCGPPESGNGGWVSGHFAGQVPTSPELPAVSVRLRTPPPLDREMATRTVPGGPDGSTTVVELFDGDHLVAQGQAVHGPEPRGIPGPVSFEDAQAAGERYEGLADHPFPTCFSCGTGRSRGDGLRLQPGRVAGSDTYACAWVPGDDVDLETVWAALDCPGGWASGIAGRPMVLGTMTARVDTLPVAGEPHVVMAWQRGEEGRKHLSGTALYAADGTLLAQAEATWIAIDPATIRPASPAGGTS